ncbi:XRE family transcriptional regulator [Burkholderia gladioli]|uniref:XRE family transcriptional regulator n=1 Tax=Burkholderia gladioli TaxID=28095 RepID=UPI0016402C6D|nr:XRE family transcriptional regulator [Burkholderia gladioli]
MKYQPPSSDALRLLKERLGYTNAQMANLFGVSTARQFHKYLSDEDRREMGFHVLMFGATNLALMIGPVASIDQILEVARSVGALIELSKE